MYPCSTTWPCVECENCFPPSSPPPPSPPKVLSFSPPRVFSVLSSVFKLPSRRFRVCLLFLLPWWVRPPHSRLSAASLSFRFRRPLVDATLCFTRSEAARATDRRRGREREGEGGSASARQTRRDVTRQERFKKKKTLGGNYGG